MPIYISGVSVTGSNIPCCVSQAIKHKLHMKSVVAVSDHANTSDVQQEEDKAKLLLGARLQVGSRGGQNYTLGVAEIDKTTSRVWQR